MIMANLSIQSPAVYAPLPAAPAAATARQTPAPALKAASLQNDSTSLQDLATSQNKGQVSLHALDYGKKGAIGGAVAGGVILPVAVYLIANYTPANLAFTAGFALQTLAVGAAGGAAVGGAGGLAVGGIRDGIEHLLKK